MSALNQDIGLLVYSAFLRSIGISHSIAFDHSIGHDGNIFIRYSIGHNTNITIGYFIGYCSISYFNILYNWYGNYELHLLKVLVVYISSSLGVSIVLIYLSSVSEHIGLLGDISTFDNCIVL